MDAATLNSIFIDSTKHVLNVMAQCSVKAGKPGIKTDNVAIASLSAYVRACRVADGAKGSIAMSFTRTGAKYLAKSMFGEDIDDDEGLNEVVGEMVNILSGDARRRMAELDVCFDGTTPCMLSGKGHVIDHETKAPTTVIPFGLPEGQFVVEFSFEI